MTAPFRRGALFLLISLSLHYGLASAQGTGGVIDGYVKDPDSRPTPGVQVVVNSPSLIQKDMTVYTNEGGYYRVPSLPPGRYTVDFILQGFQRVQRADIIVNTAQTTSVDASLNLASLEESVTVTGASPSVDPTSASLGFNYTPQLLENVPTTRNFHNIVTTIPGVETAAPYGVSPGNLENESVLGAGPFSNRYNMDGANITDPAIANNQANLFSADIIQEMQVLRGAKPAEVGYAQGGFFNIVTKSGGNNFSGELGAYYQGDQFQSENIDDRLRAAGVVRSNELIKDPDFSATAGGRIIRDRLWWFGSTRWQHRTFQLLGFDRDVDDKIFSYFWKNTYQANAQHRFTGLVNHWQEDVNYFFFGFSPALAAGPEVSMIREPSGDAGQGRWDGVLSDTVIADAGFGFNRLRIPQQFQPDATVASQDLITGQRFGNPGSNSRDAAADNFTVFGSLSMFVADAMGRHDVKVGTEYSHSPYNVLQQDIEDHQLRVSRGAPSRVLIKGTPADIKWQHRYLSFYAQDAWTIADRLTLNLGLRYDQTGVGTPEQGGGGGTFAGTYLADRFPDLNAHTYPSNWLWTWHNVAPRLAATYSLGARKRTVVKAGFGRYYHHLHSQQIQAVNPNSFTTVTYAWSDPNRDGKYQLGEEGTLLSISGGATTTADPDLRQSYSDEWTAGISHELTPGFSVNANFIFRADHDLMDTLDIGVPFSSYSPVSVADPGDDGVVGTGDDGRLTVFAQDPATFGSAQFLLSNPEAKGLRNPRDYKGLELIANKRMSDRWQFVGSFVVSESIVAVPTSSDTGGGSIFRNPNNALNAEGRDDLNQTYQVKLQGTYLGPYGIVLSGLHRYGSGFHYTRQLSVTGLPQGPVTVFAEPRGSRTTDSYNWIDFRIEKEFRFNQKRLGLIMDVFNITNASTVLQVGTRTGVDLGAPRFVRNPRIVRFGSKFSW